MNIEVPIEEMRKRKLFVATPMYAGQCFGGYAKSIQELTVLCVKYGIEMRCHFLFNESLIPRGRNYCAEEFMRSDFTHFLFIDSDISFKAEDALTLMALMSDDSPYDVLCAPYTKKVIAWEKIVTAVNKGVADDDPAVLELFAGDFVFNMLNNEPIRLDRPAEVLESGTGFMMIRRQTFEKYTEAYPQFKYLPDHVRAPGFDGSKEIMAFFDCVIDPASRRYLSEDYFFCQNVRKAGMKVWLAPWIYLEHAGFYNYRGSLIELAKLGEAATVDPSKLKKKQPIAVPPATAVNVIDPRKLKIK